jgi:hexosaminidase
MKKLYDYKFPEGESVIGVQANLWTEYVITPQRMDYMVFPRAIATAEKAWSIEDNINYDDFLRRLEKEYLYLDKRGVYYYDFRNFNAHPEPLK